MKAIIERIVTELNSETPHLYFRCNTNDNGIITIRVADHSANDHNNAQRGQFCLSFITEKTRPLHLGSGSNYEWVVDNEGWADTCHIESILKDYEITSMID